MNAMPAYVGWLDSAGLKWVVRGFRDNAERGLPFIAAITLLIDPRTGQFLSVMDGALITNLRTGAQAAVPLRGLHRGPRIRIGLYGAGAQGRTVIRAIAEIFEMLGLRGKAVTLKELERPRSLARVQTLVIGSQSGAELSDAARQA